jgi:hypothetical protein
MDAAKQLKPFAFSIALCLTTCATQPPIAPDALPPLVRDARQIFVDDCKPDAPVFGRDLVLKADLDGDAQDDYVVNGFAYQCRKDTPFCGSAGCEVQVFLSAPGGVLEQRFDGWLEEPPRIVRRNEKPALVSGAGRSVFMFDARAMQFVPAPR